MQFIIAKNRETILLGPIDWKPRFIQSEFTDLYEQEEISFEYIVPPTNESYINVGDGIEIFPITNIISPEIDTNFEHPVGPFYTFSDSGATVNYEKTDKLVPEIRESIKVIAAAIRYERENSGTKSTVQGKEVTVDTSREGRAIFVQAYTTMPDNEIITWKFPEGWLNLSKEELGSVVASGVSHVQQQFAWEQNIDYLVNNASSIEELKSIYASMFPVLE